MSFTVQISKPIKDLAGDDTTILEFQEPTFADLIKMEEVGGKELKQMFTLMGCCSEYLPAELKKLTPTDAIKCGTELLSFLAFPDVPTKKGAK
jgi:hypothetical protein